MTTPPRTPHPLTADQLAEIQARIPVVYDGPWDFEWDDSDTGQPDCWVVSYPSDNPLAGLVAEVPDYGAELAEFIAHARTDVPALLAEVDRLKGQRKYLIEQLAKRDAETGRADRAVREFLGAEAVEPDVIAQALAQLRQVQPLDTYSANRLDLAARILTGEEAAS